METRFTDADLLFRGLAADGTDGIAADIAFGSVKKGQDGLGGGIISVYGDTDASMHASVDALLTHNVTAGIFKGGYRTYIGDFRWEFSGQEIRDMLWKGRSSGALNDGGIPHIRKRFDAAVSTLPEESRDLIGRLMKLKGWEAGRNPLTFEFDEDAFLSEESYSRIVGMLGNQKPYAKTGMYTCVEPFGITLSANLCRSGNIDGKDIPNGEKRHDLDSYVYVFFHQTPGGPVPDCNVIAVNQSQNLAQIVGSRLGEKSILEECKDELRHMMGLYSQDILGSDEVRDFVGYHLLCGRVQVIKGFSGDHANCYALQDDLLLNFPTREIIFCKNFGQGMGSQAYRAVTALPEMMKRHVDMIYR